jgi:putative phage-type endonuclease
VPDLIPTASEAAWLEARRQGVTASEIAVVLGLSPYSSPYALYHQKLGILPADDDQAVFERGRVLEPYIAEKFAAAHPELLVVGDGRSLFRHDERPWQLATPDRLIADDMRFDFVPGLVIEEFAPVAVLETKTDAGSDEWGEEGTDEIPVHYRCQVIWQMDVMGVSRAYVSCLDPARWRIREYVIEHAEGCGPGRNMLAYPSLACQACDDIVLMRDAAREFLGRIERQEPPDVDWRPATIGALKQLHPSVEDTEGHVGYRLAGNYRAATRNLKYWEQRKKLYEARIREAIGSSRRAIVSGGEVIARRDVYEVKAHERKASTVDKLTPVYPKEKKSARTDGE